MVRAQGATAPPFTGRSLRHKWIPTCKGNVSHLCLLLDEGGGNGYPASRLDVGLEPLRHPGDPLKVDGFPTSWSIPVLEPESNPTGKSVGGRRIYLFIFLPSDMQVAPSVAKAQTWRRAERERVRLRDVLRGALPGKAVFAGPSEPELLPWKGEMSAVE
ncbi:uncharacterized protein WM294_007799 [Sarcoramphus papa]